MDCTAKHQCQQEVIFGGLLLHGMVSIDQVSELFMTSHCSTEVEDKNKGLQLLMTWDVEKKKEVLI